MKNANSKNTISNFKVNDTTTINTTSQELLTSCYIPWLNMLDLIVYFIHQSVPIGQITTTFLKVQRFNQTFQQHRRKMEAVIWTPQGQYISGTNVLEQKQ
jgi:hypothetical protein